MFEVGNNTFPKSPNWAAIVVYFIPLLLNSSGRFHSAPMGTVQNATDTGIAEKTKEDLKSGKAFVQKVTGKNSYIYIYAYNICACCCNLKRTFLGE